jgi:hypothetical protein
MKRKARGANPRSNFRLGKLVQEVERLRMQEGVNGIFIKIYVISVTRYNDKIFKSFRVLIRLFLWP